MLRCEIDHNDVATGARDVFDLSASSSQASGCSIDKGTGTIVVPVTASFVDISQFVSERGHEALLYRRKHEEARKKIEDLRVEVRKKLKLRHLLVDTKLSDDQQASAFARLLRSVPELLRYTEGLSLMISDEYRLPLPGSNGLAHLKWDFSISDL